MSEENENEEIVDNRQITAWSNNGSRYTPVELISQKNTVPPGIYRIEETMFGWYLNLIQDKFTFPFKIYGLDTHIVNRIARAYLQGESNLGVLFNGLKGAGKTVTAQILANWAVDNSIPVLLITQPTPQLNDFLTKTNQPVMVLFDEFEKTHDEKAQAQLLSTIDGLFRSKYKKLFLFTTNDANVNQNFIDRPSRIRYIFNFSNLGRQVIQEIVDDLLGGDLSHLSEALVNYLMSRSVRSIDTVKAAIREVNLFHEPASSFESFFNLSASIPASYKIDILDENGNTGSLYAASFLPSNNSYTYNQLFVYSREAFHQNWTSRQMSFVLYDPFLCKQIQVVSPTDELGVWVCQLSAAPEETWLKKWKHDKSVLPELLAFYTIDERPENWTPPDLSDPDTLEEFNTTETVYGTSSPRHFLVRITPNFVPQGFDARQKISYRQGLE